MKLTFRLLISLLTVVLLFVACDSQQDSSSNPNAKASVRQSDTIDANKAGNHVGEGATVCGEIVDTKYSTGSSGNPTFLNFDKPYPNHPFVVVIWGKDRPNFPPNPEIFYRFKQVCVTGLIESFKGKPEIIASDKSQLSITN